MAACLSTPASNCIRNNFLVSADICVGRDCTWPWIAVHFGPWHIRPVLSTWSTGPFQVMTTTSAASRYLVTLKRTCTKAVPIRNKSNSWKDLNLFCDRHSQVLQQYKFLRQGINQNTMTPSQTTKSRILTWQPVLQDSPRSFFPVRLRALVKWPWSCRASWGPKLQ